MLRKTQPTMTTIVPIKNLIFLLYCTESLFKGRTKRLNVSLFLGKARITWNLSNKTRKMKKGMLLLRILTSLFSSY